MVFALIGKEEEIMFYIECPDCDCRLDADLAQYVFPQCSIELN